MRCWDRFECSASTMPLCLRPLEVSRWMLRNGLMIKAAFSAFPICLSHSKMRSQSFFPLPHFLSEQEGTGWQTEHFSARIEVFARFGVQAPTIFFLETLRF